MDVAVFRSGLWAFVAKPDSSGGWVALRSQIDPLLLPVPKRPSILLIGDSRMTEVCAAERLEGELGEPRVTVRDAAMPGSTPRVWPWLLRELMGGETKWTLLVVGLASFDDDGETGDFTERGLDLSFLNPLTRVSDAPALAANFEDPDRKRDVWLGALVKTFAWRHDQRDALAHPWQRYVELRFQYGSRRWGPYLGNPASLAGVRVDGDRIVGLPPERQDLEPLLRNIVWPYVPFVDNTAYRRHWLTKLVDLAADHGTTVVFVRLPSRVLMPANARPPREVVIDELRQRANVRVLDRELATPLERPEFFFDALHANRAARERFSQMLAEVLVRECAALLGR